ncbi:MAG: EF-hand domain-containing protein [Verrucomicrobiales bacterium]|nr:EF-hand domain-containing protein [Verrucomicrobiales bacterium]
MKSLLILLSVFFLSGFLSAQEQGLESLERREKEKAELELWAGKLYKLFRKADTDGDKALSLLELRNHLDKKMEPGKTSEKDFLLRTLKKKNPAIDLNKDGILTKEELVGYLDMFIAMENKQEATPS